MATTSGPIFPSENLVFMVDAGNTKSYSTADTSKWYDISGKQDIIWISEVELVSKVRLVVY